MEARTERGLDFLMRGYARCLGSSVANTASSGVRARQSLDASIGALANLTGISPRLNCSSDALGLLFVRARTQWIEHKSIELRRSRTLLNEMGQLMGQQSAPFVGLRCILAFREYQVAPDRICERIDRSCRADRERIRVHPHLAEVAFEALLEKRSRATVKGLAGRMQHVMYDRRDDANRARICGLALQ